MKINLLKDSNPNIPVFGYQNRLKQLSTHLNIQINVPNNLDLHNLSKEITERFEVDILPVETLVSRSLTKEQESVQNYFWIGMSLSASLLRAVKIPVFSPGVIKEIKIVSRAGDQRIFLGSFQVPLIENHPESFTFLCIRYAFELCRHFCKPGLTEEVAEHLMNNLDTQLIKRAEAMIPGGKSTIPVLKTAFDLDIPFCHLGKGIYQLGWGGFKHISDRSSTELDSAIGAKLSSNKLITANILRQAGLPVPFHLPATTLEQALEESKKIGFPLVVKPADRDRGEGVSVGVENDQTLTEGFEFASKFSKNILIERQVPGVCHRILIANKSHIYTVARLPKSIIGDGIRTVFELCQAETSNENRKPLHLRRKPFIFDMLTEETLKKQGVAYDTIPDPEQSVYVRPIETTLWGGTPKLLMHEVHADNVKVAIEAAQIMGLNIAGVDLISEDISKPWWENGAVINEINYAPFLGQLFDYQKAGVKQILKELFPKGGRIPIEIYIGDIEALHAALQRQEELKLINTRCFVTSHTNTYDVEGELRLNLESSNLFDRCRALLLNKNVDFLIMVIHTDELFFKGLPVDSINKIEIINDRLLSHTDASKTLNDSALTSLISGLNQYLR